LKIGKILLQKIDNDVEESSMHYSNVHYKRCHYPMMVLIGALYVFFNADSNDTKTKRLRDSIQKLCLIEQTPLYTCIFGTLVHGSNQIYIVQTFSEIVAVVKVSCDSR
jgi:hypothetical protein